MADVIFYAGETGQNLYVRFQHCAYCATALTEGTLGGIGVYSATEAAIAALPGMDVASTGLGFPYTVRVGAPSVENPDEILAADYLAWSGTAQMAMPVELTPEQMDALAVAIAGALTDVDQEPVSPARTFLLVPTAEGLQGEDSKTIYKSQGAATFAVDFQNDATVNQQIKSVDIVEIVSGGGPPGGMTFDNYGRDKRLAKFRATPVEDADYIVRVQVKYSDLRQTEGRVRFTVVE